MGENLDIEFFNSETQKHIDNVSNYLLFVSKILINRGIHHDESKFSTKEKDHFIKYTPLLKKTTYGSDKYKTYLKKLKPALVNHYKFNKHHPEHTRQVKEKWISMVGYDKPYFINNFGDIVMLKNPLLGYEDANIVLVQPHISPIGYLKVTLRKKNKFESVFIHEMVIKYFSEKPTECNRILHLNDNLQDNYYGNLKWVKKEKSNLEYYMDEMEIVKNNIVVSCVEKDIVTIGVSDMVNKLNSEITEEEIVKCLIGSCNKIENLTFRSFNIEKPQIKTDIRFMNLIDLMEMLFDWIAASKRHSDGNVFKSIKINKNRFKYDSIFEDIFINTVKYVNNLNNFEFLETYLTDVNINVRTIVYEWYHGIPVHLESYKKKYDENDLLASSIIIEKILSSGKA